MSQINTVDEFLNYRTGTGGAGNGFLRKWRKRTPPVVNTWMSTRILPFVLWQHGFPKVNTWDDKTTGKPKREVGFTNYNCFENDEDLKRQFEEDDGVALFQPKRCPICRLGVCVLHSVMEGALTIGQPIFRYQGMTTSKTLYAGGIAGLFRQKKLETMPDEALEDFQKTGIKLSEAWLHMTAAKASWIFCVADNSDVAAGLQIAQEATALRNQVVNVIGASMKSLGRDDGDPFKNPYCIQWEYLPSEQMEKRYSATRMERIEMTPEIEKLIRGPLPKKLKEVTDPFNLKSVRATLEQAALVKLPWDWIFDVDVSDAADVGEFPPLERGPEPIAAMGDVACAVCGPGVPEERCPHVECDSCHRPMLQSASRCPHCGVTYAGDFKADNIPY